jgi:hypothetical protein
MFFPDEIDAPNSAQLECSSDGLAGTQVRSNIIALNGVFTQSG